MSLKDETDTMNNNNPLYTKLRKKYRIKSKKSILSFFFKINPKQKKFNRIPESFAKNFNQESYLQINPDVKKSIQEGKFENALEHFILYGYDEVKRGQRRIGEEFPFLTEEEYLEENLDVKSAVANKAFSCGFEHFILYGMMEILAGSRNIQAISSYEYKEPLLTKTIKNEIETFKKQPLISIIIPVYNVEEKWLKLAIESIENQWYTHWEICIADDDSTNIETLNYLEILKSREKVKIVTLSQNGNISKASNEALRLSIGEYIALMDNDDELTPDALYEVVKAINEKDAEFIYSDEDKLELDGRYSDPYFKPDYAPDMFLSQNYMSHLGVIKKSLIGKVGGWEVGLEGSQDYDLYLKVLEHTNKVVHIPKVLYHWRKVVGSTAAIFSDKSYAQKAGQKALTNAMIRRGIEATVENGQYPGTYRVRYAIKDNPLVSIIIPFKDKTELLEMCLTSIVKKSTYQNYEIIGMSNKSDESETFKMMEYFSQKEKRITFYEYNNPFNYSEINNYAINHYANGEHVILLNNDIEVISPSWIEEMLVFSQRDDIGAVGAKLYYPNDTVQHAGVIIGIGGVAGHSHKYFDKNETGYFSRLGIIQNISAVTAACLMVKKSIYRQLNGLNETDLTIAFNDVDFCLRLKEKGYLNIYTPYCEAYHHESISRGAENNEEKIKRFNSEVAYMQNRHKEILKEGDPYYNVNLTLEHENFEIKGTN